jgi:micrococcal nuclease
MLNQEMVKAGFAWWFYKYSNNRDLGMMQLETRLQHIGLWKAKNPVAPLVFRKVKDLLH